MEIEIFETAEEMGTAAATAGASILAKNDHSSFIVATGASQFTMLQQLVKADLPWHQFTGFHLDEYIGIPISHPASFRRYLWERFVSKLPFPLANFHFLNAEEDPDEECARVGVLLSMATIEVAFVGIGENGHLAFNDPPADFASVTPYLIVDLDETCRRQQLGEGWFSDLESVPKQAVSMSVNHIMQSKTIICTVPDKRKAEAVRNAVNGPVTPDVPASILQRHPDCRLYLDTAAASLL